MSDDAELGPQLSARLTYLLKRALVELHRLHDDRLGPHGIDARELSVLLFLDGREPESQQQTARHLGVNRTTMVALLDSLEAKRLVVRRTDAGDRRRNVVVVTDTGRDVLAHATRASDDAERQLLADLDATEAAQLRALLQRVATKRA